jgi:hypothetical protein
MSDVRLVHIDGAGLLEWLDDVTALYVATARERPEAPAPDATVDSRVVSRRVGGRR